MVITALALSLAAPTGAGVPARRQVSAAPQGGGRAAPAEGAATTAPKVGNPNGPVTVDADKMERFGKESLVIFTGKVIARQNNSVQYADRMEVYMDEKGDRILRTVSTGAVRIITSDCKTGTAQRAEYFDLEQRVVLIGNARVWQEENVISGDTITMWLKEDRTIVDGGKQERVKGIFYRREDAGDGAAAAPKPAPATCNN
jgi:lipopolysaccharide export system protein LptA